MATGTVDSVRGQARIAAAVIEMVEKEGFEPSKCDRTSDLQSDPFGRSGTPPKRGRILQHSTLLSSAFLIKNLSLAT